MHVWYYIPRLLEQRETRSVKGLPFMLISYSPVPQEDATNLSHELVSYSGRAADSVVLAWG